MAKEMTLAHVKPKDLDFGVDADAKRSFGHHAEWPEFVKQGLALLKGALAKIGINLETENFPSPDALLETLIEKVEQAPVANWQKWLVLAALKWLHGKVHHDELMAAMKGP